MNPKLKLWTSFPELLTVDACRPIPASKVLPDWWKTMPSRVVEPSSMLDRLLGTLTAKRCPAMPDFMLQGIVIPMWSDTYIRVNGADWEVVSARAPKLSWSRHSDEQFINHTPSWVDGKITAALKAESPWYVKTPPGYSVYQMPLFYNFDTNYTVMPGSIQTDVHHQVNPQLLIHSKQQEVFIPQGTPFMWLIPYQRQDFDYEFVDAASMDDELRAADFAFLSKFSKGYGSNTKRTCPMRKA
jgi:hypothetical protein